MSCAAIAWAFLQELPCAHKFVLVSLADAAHDNGECWPSQATVAKKCGLSRQYVNKILGDLERDGFLIYVPRLRENGADSSCQYRLAVPEEQNKPQAPSPPGVIYLVAAHGLIKIGISRQLDRRLAGIKTAIGSEIKVIKVWGATMAQARRIEKAAHAHFHDHRRAGEWFAVESEAAKLVINGLVSTEETPGVVLGDTPVSTETTPRVNRDDTRKLNRNLNQFVSDETASDSVKPPKKRGRASFAGEFAEWWEAYPHKVGKAAAEAKFAVARRAAELSELLLGVRRYIESKPPDRPWCNPATWLQQTRWLDQPAPNGGGNGHDTAGSYEPSRPSAPYGGEFSESGA